MDRKITVAVIDDHLLFRKGMVALTNMFPRHVICYDAPDGNTFINQVKREGPPDIALLDIQMPGMDGYATAEWLTMHYPEVRILALSTMDAESAIIRMIRCGARGYLLKDADTEEVKRALEDVMSIGYHFNNLITRSMMNVVRGLAGQNDPTAPFVNLTPKEIEFLKWNASELTYKEIADKMNLSARTVEGYRDHLCEKLGVRTRVGLVLYAVRNQLIKA